MTLEYFVENLERIKPGEDLLIKQGFTGIHLAVIKKNYVLQRRSDRKIAAGSGSIIEMLLNDFEAQYIRFNDYSFEKEVNYIGEVAVFCRSSYSFLGYKKGNEEIIEIDMEENSTISYCAKNVESFLEALLKLLELKSLRLQGLASKKDTQVNEQYLNLCVSLAGGQRYARFYKALVS